MSSYLSNEALFIDAMRERYPGIADRVIAQSSLPFSYDAITLGQLSSLQGGDPYTQAEETSSLLSREPAEASLPPWAPEPFLDIASAVPDSDSPIDDTPVREVISAVTSLRYRLRLTQKAFAAPLGISPRTLQGWEQGRRLPSGPARILLQRIIEGA